MKTLWLIIPALAFAATKQAEPGEDLARSRGCFECHGMDTSIVGPTFREIAARYKGDAKAAGSLFQIVKKGGKGNWAEISRGVPMPPYSGRLTDDEIKRLVDWNLNLLTKH